MKKRFYLISIILMLISLVALMPNIINAADITVTNGEELANALGNATAEGNKVTLNAPVTLGEYYNDNVIIIDAGDREIEVDLAGNTIESITMREIFYLKSGTLIFNDLIGGGKVNNSNEHSYTIFVMDGGNIVINSGEFTSYGDIINCMKGNLTINGGNLKSKDSSAINLNIHGEISAYEAIINGGTFIGEIYGIAVSSWPDVNMKIKWGTFEGTKSALNISNNDTLVTLSGGTFTATSTDEKENEGAISIVSTYYSEQGETYSPYSPINLLEEGYTFYDDDTIELKKELSNSSFSQHHYGTKSTVTVGLKKNDENVEQDIKPSEEIKEKDETPKTGSSIVLINKVAIILSIAFIGLVIIKRK